MECLCGCGENTKKGNYFIHGHHARGEGNPKWNGGKTVLGNRNKYFGIRMPSHPRTEAGGYVREHVLVSEKALGKLLPERAVVHHVDGDGRNNNNNNLVVCEDDFYHRLLHKRERAYRECGNAWWLKCKFCKQYDAPENLRLVPSRNYAAGHHTTCQKEYDKKRRG